jgi:hypothetical protein
VDDDDDDDDDDGDGEGDDAKGRRAREARRDSGRQGR